MVLIINEKQSPKSWKVLPGVTASQLQEPTGPASALPTAPSILLFCQGPWEQPQTSQGATDCFSTEHVNE